MESAIQLQAIVDGVGDLTRSLKGLDPTTLPAGALEGIQAMRGLFGRLIDAEMSLPSAGAALADVEGTIAATAADLLAALDGHTLPDNVQALAVDLRGMLQEAFFTGCVPA